MSVSCDCISILYVDDEPTLLDLAKEFLKQSGEFDIDITQSAAEALALLGKRGYDGVISDYQMPEMDGIELLKAIRSRYPDLPFIIFTGKGREEIVIQAFDAGADYYVQKGGENRSQFRELSHKIKRAVEKRLVEKALKVSQDQYRNVVEDQTEFICRFTPDGRLSFVNNAYCRYFGMEREKLIGHQFIPQIPEDDAERVRSHFASLTRNSPIGTSEHRVILPGGSVRWHQWSDRAIYDESGTLVEYQSVGQDITDRKTAELDLARKNEELCAAYEQLTATEEELRSSYNDLTTSQHTLENKETALNAIIQESPIPQFVIDRNHKILYWNHALAIYSGMVSDEMTGTDQQWRAFYPDKRPCLADLLVDNAVDKLPEWYLDKYAKSTLISDAYEATDFFPHMGRGGKWLHFTAGLIKNRNGEIIGAVESLEDITERKIAELEIAKKNEEIGAAYEQLTAAEEELRQNYEELGKNEQAFRESEERYRNVVEDQTEFICRFTPDGRLSFVNDAYCRYFGLDKATCIGKQHTAVILPEDLQQMKDHLAVLSPENPSGVIEHRIIMSSGIIRWQRWSDRAIFDRDGHIIEYQSVGRDITEKREVEELLQRSEERHRSLFEGIPVGLYRTTPAGQILDVNPALVHTLGYPDRESLLAISGSDVYANTEARKEWQDRIEHEGIVRDFETQFRKYDGATIWVRETSKAVRDDHGQVVYYEGILEDITERKLAEERLKVVYEDLQAAYEQLAATEEELRQNYEELAKNEQALRESEERYRNVVCDQTEFICRFRPDGTHVFVNDAYCRYFNKTREELIGRNFQPELFPEDRKKIQEVFASLTPENPVGLIRQRVIFPDGSIRWQRWVDRAIYDKSGTLVEYQSVGRDVTDVVSAELELAKSEERYRNVVEDQTEFICRFRPDGTHVFVNDAYCRYFKKSREELIDHTFIPQIPEEDRRLIVHHFKSLTPEHPVATIDHRIVMPDGTIRWQRWVDRAIYDKSGTLVEYQSVGRDITDWKVAELELAKKNEELGAAYEQLTAIEEELRTNFEDLVKSQHDLKESEERYRNVVEDLTEFICRFLPDGRLSFVNNAYCRYFGLDRATCINTRHIVVIPLDDRRRMKEHLAALSPENPTGIIEHRIIMSSGDVRWQHWSDRAIFDREGHVIEYQSVGRDITEQIKAEEKLKIIYEDLHAAYEQLTATEEELRQNYKELGKSEQALRESEERYRNVVEDQNEFICRFRPDGTHVFVNDAYCKYFNKTREELIGKIFTPEIPEEDSQHIALHFKSLTPQHPVATIDHRIIMPDESICWMRWSDRAIYDKSGTLVEYQSVGRDITDYKQTEEALRLSEGRYCTLAGKHPDRK